MMQSDNITVDDLVGFLLQEEAEIEHKHTRHVPVLNSVPTSASPISSSTALAAQWFSTRSNHLQITLMLMVNKDIKTIAGVALCVSYVVVPAMKPSTASKGTIRLTIPQDVQIPKSVLASLTFLTLPPLPQQSTLPGTLTSEQRTMSLRILANSILLKTTMAPPS